MNAPRSEDFIARLEALAEPTRLRLLRLLERHELGVTALCDVLQLPQSTVSRHLKQLGDQGWLASRRAGTSNLYRMAGADLDPATARLWQLVRDEAGHWPSARQDQLRLQRRLDERRSASRSFFAGAAATWDALRAQLYGETFGLEALTALLPAAWTVADLACGTGELSARLAPHVARVIAVDHSDAMLDAARRRLGPFDNVDLREGELEALPVEDAGCDAALCVLALTYVAEPPAVLHEIARVVRPGGRAVVVDLLPHERDDFRHEMGHARAGFEPREVESLLTAAGFTGPRTRTLPPARDAKGPALFLASATRG